MTATQIAANVAAKFREDAARFRLAALETYRTLVPKLAADQALSEKDVKALEKAIDDVGFPPTALEEDIRNIKEAAKLQHTIRESKKLEPQSGWEREAIRATAAAESLEKQAREERGRAALARGQAACFASYASELDRVMNSLRRITGDPMLILNPPQQVA